MSERIKGFFSSIAKSYDLMNHLLSVGFDVSWENAAARECIIGKDKYSIIDIATGTGNLAFKIEKFAKKYGKGVSIKGVDINEAMLGIAKAKARRLNSSVEFVYGDALSLDCNDECFDVASSAFALRNLDDLEKFVIEAKRILKKNGKLVLMDMALPSKWANRNFFKLYSNIVKVEGSLIDKEAYAYLIESINRFDKNRVASLLHNYGFKNLAYRELAMGIAFMFTGIKS